MVIAFKLFIGFFVIYYIIFFITLIYISIIEEWCCANRIPFWYNNLKERYTRITRYILVPNNDDDNV